MLPHGLAGTYPIFVMSGYSIDSCGGLVFLPDPIGGANVPTQEGKKSSDVVVKS